MTITLSDDPVLAGVPRVDGFPALEPCLLYRRLGQGGMGAVYLARHTRLEVEVAVKCLRIRGASVHDAAVQRFRREARLAAEIAHPNLVRVFDVLEREGLHYMVMEYVHGETARQRVQRKGALAIEEATAIVRAAATGLTAAHARRVVHRDVKPDNILISVTSEVKVADLGLAKALEPTIDEPTATIGPVAMGTPSYMPPEQWEDARDVTPAADVYALGAVLYFLLIGEDGVRSGTWREVMRHVLEEPFPDPRAARPEVDAGLAALIAECTRKDASERPADASAFLERLASVAPQHSTPEAAPDEEVESESVISPPPYRSILRAQKNFESGAVATATRTVGGSAPVRVKKMPCPACGKTLTLLPQHVGKRVRCSKCTTVVRIPDGTSGVASTTRAAETVEVTHTFERPREANQKEDRRAGGAKVQGGRLSIVLGVLFLVATGLAVSFSGILSGEGDTGGDGGGTGTEPLPAPDPGPEPIDEDEDPLIGKENGTLPDLEQEAADREALRVSQELRSHAAMLAQAGSASELRTALAAASIPCDRDPDACELTGLAAAQAQAEARLSAHEALLLELEGLEQRVRSLGSIEEAVSFEEAISEIQPRLDPTLVEPRRAALHDDLIERVAVLARTPDSVPSAVAAVRAIERLKGLVTDAGRRGRLDDLIGSAKAFVDTELQSVRAFADFEPFVAPLAPPDGQRGSALDATWDELLARLEEHAAEVADLSATLELLKAFELHLAAAPDPSARAAIKACADPLFERIAKQIETIESVLKEEAFLSRLVAIEAPSFGEEMSGQYAVIVEFAGAEGRGQRNPKLTARFVRKLRSFVEDLSPGELHAGLLAIADALDAEAAVAWLVRLAEGGELLRKKEYEKARDAFEDVEEVAGKGSAAWSHAKLGKAQAYYGLGTKYVGKRLHNYTKAREICEIVLHDLEVERDWADVSIAAWATSRKAFYCYALERAWNEAFKRDKAPKNQRNAEDAAKAAALAIDELNSKYAGEKGPGGASLIPSRR